MPLTNAGNLGQNQLLRHLIQDGPYNVQYLEVWPWVGVDGKFLDVATTERFKTPSANILAACGAITDRTRDPIDRNKRFVIPSIQTRYDICFGGADSIEYPNNLYAEQDALAILSMLYEYSRLLDTGGAGFPALTTLTDQLVNLAGAAPVLEDFNRTLLRVTNNQGFDVVVMGNQDALNTYWKACYERGVNPFLWQEDVPANMGGTASRPQSFVQHARWYVNELIPTRGVDKLITNVYFIQLGYNPDYGTAKGTFGIVPKPRVGNMFVRRELEGHIVDPAGGGINTTHSVFWSFPAGVAVASNRSLAVLHDMQIAPF